MDSTVRWDWIAAICILVSVHISQGYAESIWREDGIDRFHRPYRILTLDNGMNVFLMQDENATLAGGDLRVDAGSINDPWDMQGRANLFEWVLPPANKKYEGADPFLKFTNKYGGWFLAYSSENSLIYPFTVASEKLPEALEQLEAMVFHPAFNDTHVAQAVNKDEAVFQKMRTSAYNMKERVLRITSTPGHPYSKFVTGNRETLQTTPESKGINVTEKLYEFHEEYFIPERVTLALIANHSLDDLEKFVGETLEKIPRRGIRGGLQIFEPAWGLNELGTKTEILLGEGAEDQMELYFPVPKELLPYFKEYYCPLFLYKCRECLYGNLDMEGWIQTLYCEAKMMYRGFYYVIIQFRLTPKGFENTDGVVETVFQYIELLRSKGPQKWFWDQHHAIMHIKQGLKMKEATVTEATSAIGRHLMDLEDLTELKKHLHGQPQHVEFPETEISEGLTHMVPGNMRLVVMSTKFENQTEKYDPLYEVHYNFGKIDDKQFSDVPLNPKLHLPDPLKGLADKNINILDPVANATMGPAAEPNKIYESEYMKIWHKFDNNLNVPTVSIDGAIISPYASTTVWDSVMLSLLIKALDQCRNKWPSYSSYADELLGTDVTLEKLDQGKGIKIKITGPSSVLQNAINNLAHVFSECTIQEEDFNGVLNLEKNQLLHRMSMSPCMGVEHDKIFYEKSWSVDENIAALNGVTLRDIQEYKSKFFSQIRMTWLVYGNMVHSDAKATIKHMESQITQFYRSKPLTKNDSRVRPLERYIQIPAGTNWVVNVKSREAWANHTCTAIYLQSDTQTFRDSVMLLAIQALVTKPLPLALNARHGVYSVAWSGLGKPKVFEIMIVGASKPSVVQEKVDTFLANFRNETLMKISVTEFATMKASLIVSREREVLGMTAVDFFNEIYYGELNFNPRQIQELEAVTLENVVEYFEVLTNKCNSRRVSFHISRDDEYGNSKGQNGSEPLLNEEGNLASCGKQGILELSKIEEWKQRSYLFPALA